jgi:hypothetical protein
VADDGEALKLAASWKKFGSPFSGCWYIAAALQSAGIYRFWSAVAIAICTMSKASTAVITRTAIPGAIAVGIHMTTFQYNVTLPLNQMGFRTAILKMEKQNKETPAHPFRSKLLCPENVRIWGLLEDVIVPNQLIGTSCKDRICCQCAMAG